MRLSGFEYIEGLIGIVMAVRWRHATCERCGWHSGKDSSSWS